MQAKCFHTSNTKYPHTHKWQNPSQHQRSSLIKIIAFILLLHEHFRQILRVIELQCFSSGTEIVLVSAPPSVWRMTSPIDFRIQLAFHWRHQSIHWPPSVWRMTSPIDFRIQLAFHWRHQSIHWPPSVWRMTSPIDRIQLAFHWRVDTLTTNFCQRLFKFWSMTNSGGY
jgi:hypothetical protein